MKNIILVVAVLLIIVFGSSKMNWGRITMQPGEIVTVTGQAKTVQKNQIASFYVGVSVSNMNKESAVSEVNQKAKNLIASVKNFGIKEADIQTQNVSTYQDQYTVKGQWTVSNTIEIVLREIDRASALVDLLNASGATNVSGPNYRMDDTNQAEADLIDKAIKDAREKAEIIAKASGRKLGKVMTVNENGGGVAYPMLALSAKDGMGGGAPVEPGTSTISKSVTVVFELK